MSHPSDALLAKDRELREQYHKAVGKDAKRSKLDELSAAIAENVAAISASISQGASPCPQCDGHPAGMLKTPAHMHRDAEVSPVYEVGCGACGLRSRGPSPDRTVERWNAGEYVVAKGA